MRDQKRLVERFNEKFGIGDKIMVEQDDNSLRMWTVKKPATLLPGAIAVIWPEELAGCYAAHRVQGL